ncbi:hypothetical protein BH20ACT2_BH20ACT2_07780 [soil metagenome]
MAERTPRETFRLATLVVAIVLLTLFVVFNTDSVQIDFVVTDVRLPLIVVLLGTAGLGAVIALLLVRRRGSGRSGSTDHDLFSS